MNRRATRRAAEFALLGLIALTGCGDSGSDQSDKPASTVTVVEKTKTVVEKAKPAAKAKAAPASEPSDAAESGGSDKIRVPNVVGKDHQLAQDTMQAAGLYNLREKDATGQDRLLIYDRNWTDVAQDPPAGTMVSPDATITLSAKKDGE